jgi:hypothetical protein
MHGAGAGMHGAGAGMYGAGAGMHSATALPHAAIAGMYAATALPHAATALPHGAGAGLHGAYAGVYGAGAQVHDARLACTMEVPTERIDFGVRWQASARHRFGYLSRLTRSRQSKPPSPLRSAGALQIFRPRQRTIENSPGFQAWVSD